LMHSISFPETLLTALHGATSIKEESHGVPPFFGSRVTDRARCAWPMPHVALQPLHPDQSLTSQATGSLPQSGHMHFAQYGQFGGGGLPTGTTLQGAISDVGPVHDLPSPAAACPILRVRSWIPSHEQEQAPHSPQSANSQSWSGLHVLPTLHVFVSRDRPTAGLPHAVFFLATPRSRQVTPPSQEDEHVSHGDQSSHSASTHARQDCVLHGATSLMSETLQVFPAPTTFRAT